MKNYLSKASLTSIMLTIIVLGFVDVHGQSGTIILFTGLAISLITALVGEKGQLRTFSISIISLVAAVYTILFIGNYIILSSY
ncbi:hypothetical protein QA612_17465 [Evansella sp. AB-P1]|uniref:hypothetical protein n=1 Tax=Evansella sp. AB-P1 TaxID=3037653 RepID=UPI00241FCEC4|nr:hypothetical protein [Evansella sp. AB-P1]MDG5789251.1 hypothetical protein [Evansella sp. AB-P1]